MTKVLLAVHLDADGSVVAELNADVLPAHPALEEETPDDDTQAFFDYEGGFIDENTLVAGTVERDEEPGTGRHRLVDAVHTQLIDQIAYPFDVSGLPKALADGTWYTVSHLELHTPAGPAPPPARSPSPAPASATPHAPRHPPSQ